MAIDERDDLFHPAPSKDYTWSETNWFGLMYVPEKGIQFDLYAWFHPNLGVAYSGFYASRGKLRDQLCADYFDYRSWLPMPSGNLDCYSLENGLSVKILEPLKVYQLDYVDADRGTELHATWEAIMPPVPFPMGEHLEQAGRVLGTLRLNGVNHDVDCMTVRDRSWVLRSEAPRLGRRPTHFVSCAFSDGTVVCLTLAGTDPRFDEGLETTPAWLAQDNRPATEFVPFCWVFREGTHRQVKAAQLRISREPDGFFPKAFEAHCVDDHGCEYALSGEIVNYFPLRWMQNNLFPCCMSKITCNEQTAFGTYAEMLEQDHVRKLLEI